MTTVAQDRQPQQQEPEEPAFWSITPAGWNAVCSKLSPAQARRALEVYLRIEQPLLLPILAKALERRP